MNFSITPILRKSANVLLEVFMKSFATFYFYEMIIRINVFKKYWLMISSFYLSLSIQKQQRVVFYKKGVLKNSSVGVYFLIKMKPATLLKKYFDTAVFLSNLPNFQEKLFSQNTFGVLLLCIWCHLRRTAPRFHNFLALFLERPSENIFRFRICSEVFVSDLFN